MSTLRMEEVFSHPRGTHSCADAFDIEQFINPENLTSPSPSLSSAKGSTFNAPSIPRTPSPHVDHTEHDERQTFSKPSHQYGEHKQQTSLPMGAIAHTVAFNETDHLAHLHARGMNQEDYDLVLPNNGYFGAAGYQLPPAYGPAPQRSHWNPEYPAPFVQHAPMPMPGNSFAHPTHIAGQQPLPTFQPTPHMPKRAYPGMHQALADQRAQAEAQARTESHQAQEMEPSESQSRSGSPEQQEYDQNAIQNQASISRLLARMKHDITGAPRTDADDADSHLTFKGRTKKSLAEMDEDELLLVSEEGKNMNSKDRRQLRNKVSARAFRSRRKEHLSDLENRVAQTEAEINHLQALNRQLMDENRQYKELTQMMMASSEFPGAMNNMTSNEGQMPAEVYDDGNQMPPDPWRFAPEPLHS